MDNHFAQAVEDIKLMGTVFLLGTVVDALLTLGGLFIFNETETLVNYSNSMWLSLLWAAFAGTVYHSLTAFNGRMAVAALAGAIFAPLGYIAGAKFGAVELGASVVLSYIFYRSSVECNLPAVFLFIQSF